jgi:hypothetical protein
MLHTFVICLCRMHCYLHVVCSCVQHKVSPTLLGSHRYSRLLWPCKKKLAVFGLVYVSDEGGGGIVAVIDAMVVI